MLKFNLIVSIMNETRQKIRLIHITISSQQNQIKQKGFSYYTRQRQMQSPKQTGIKARISQQSQQNSYSYIHQNQAQRQRQRQSSSIMASQPQTHQCEYYAYMVKLQKSNNRKNRQIQTLNRIIKNLKQDINQLSTNKQKHNQQLHSFKQQIQQLQAKLRQLQLKQLEYQRQINQQKLEGMIRRSKVDAFKNYSSSKNGGTKYDRSRATSQVRRDRSLQYFSECHGSRNTEERIKEPKQQEYGNQNYNYNLNESSNINIREKYQYSSTKKYQYPQQSNQKTFSRGVTENQFNPYIYNQSHSQSQQSFYSPPQNQNNFYNVNVNSNSNINANMNLIPMINHIRGISPNMNKSPLNMGELFMGRKSKIDMDVNSISRQPAWGKPELLNQPFKNYGFASKNEPVKRGSIYDSQMNYENAINYLKKQNQHLKIPLFF